MTFAPFDLSAKVALVTGGNSGIGSAPGWRSGQAFPRWSSGAPTKLQEPRRRGAPATHGVLAQRVDEGPRERGGRRRPRRSHGRPDRFRRRQRRDRRRGPVHRHSTTDAWRRVTTINLDAVFWTLPRGLQALTSNRAKAGDPGGPAGGDLLGVGHRTGPPATRPTPPAKAGVIAHDSRPGGGVRPPRRRARQRRPARLDPLGHDRPPADLGHLQREGHLARAAGPLGRAGGFQRHRRSPRPDASSASTPATPSSSTGHTISRGRRLIPHLQWKEPLSE